MATTNYPNGLTAEDSDAVPTVVTTGVSKIAAGEASVTGATLDVVTGLSTVVSVQATLGQAPGATAGDVFAVSAAKHATAGTITLSIWQDDATAATEDTAVFWVAYGT